VAFGKHFIDEVNRLPAVAGRRTRPERRFELRTWHGLPSHPPAGKTPGLARQIIDRQLEGLEPPAEAFGTHQAIGRGNGIGHGRAQGIIREEMDAWGIPVTKRFCCCLNGPITSSFAPPSWYANRRCCPSIIPIELNSSGNCTCMLPSMETFWTKRSIISSIHSRY
jgi:hypothetical protein